MRPRKALRGRVRCSTLGEERLLEQLLPEVRANFGSVVVGVGDDCAVVQSKGCGKYLVLKTDCLVEGIHFRPAIPAKLVGWKAMVRPLSDFAAMSAAPEFALV